MLIIAKTKRATLENVEHASLNEICSALVPSQKSKGKAGTKKTNAVAAQVSNLEVEESNIVYDHIYAIENLKKDEAIKRVLELEDSHEQTYFEIGGVLSLIKTRGWFAPHKSFDEWVEKNTAMRRSKARVLVQIYNAIAESGATWAQIKGIGWTKLRAIAKVLKPDNADYWIKFASTNSKMEIVEKVRKTLALNDKATDGSSNVTKNMSFKLHVEQTDIVTAALQKAKAQGDTVVDAVALEYICLDFMGGMTVNQRLKMLSRKALAATFSEVLNSVGNETAQDFLAEVYKSVVHEFEVPA